MICFEVLCLPAYDFGKPGPIKSDVFLNFANGAGPSSIKKNSGRFLDALREGFKEKNQVKSLVIGQTSLDRPRSGVFMNNKIYTWSHLKIFIFASVLSVYICP